MHIRHPSNLRNDVLTAALIDHGVALSGIAGPSATFPYLVQRRIPLVIIKRVMARPGDRRELGVVGLPPVSR